MAMKPRAYSARERDDGSASLALEEEVQPKRVLRTCVASMYCSADFGPLVAAEAQRRGFFEAPRQAFVADGQQYNWTLQRAYFPHFVAIADFIHVLCYLYPAAWAVQGDDSVLATI